MCIFLPDDSISTYGSESTIFGVLFPEGTDEGINTLPIHWENILIYILEFKFSFLSLYRAYEYVT